jgi:bifunctional DNA-binding transcriptional regulator/antitoxin component of YhaV-PrlF toxin-antitoxin module
MGEASAVWAEVDEQGRLVIPLEQAASFGLRPGAQVRLEAGRLKGYHLFWKGLPNAAKSFIGACQHSLCVRMG